MLMCESCISPSSQVCMQCQENYCEPCKQEHLCEAETNCSGCGTGSQFNRCDSCEIAAVVQGGVF